MGSGRLLWSAVLSLVWLSAAQSEELPLYELGVGLAGLKTPHYLGAEQDHNLLTPLPYLIYRGEYIRFDRSGLKTYLVDEDRFDLNISANATLPVDSDDNRARTGMDDLDLLLEIGPTLRYTAWKSSDGDRQLRLDLPLRGAFSADGLELDYQGLSTSPGLVYFSKLGQWDWTASYSAIFSDDRYHGYFYDVDTPHVTAQRSQYSADGGYTASRFSLSATRHYPNWFVGGFVRYYSLHGAANRDSDLVRQQGNLSAGFMVAWLFKKSATTVTRDPEPAF